MFEGVRNGAIVVAHPDDEALWCGGLMARYPARWTVICCSIPRSDPIRAWKLFDACAALGATARLLPFEEAEARHPLTHLAALPPLTGYDCIVTHNQVGEYGHVQHVGVHRFLADRDAPEKIVTIGYGDVSSGEGGCIALDASEMARKLDALRCYDHAAPSDGGKPKWRALLDRYAPMFDLSVETYERLRS